MSETPFNLDRSEPELPDNEPPSAGLFQRLGDEQCAEGRLEAAIEHYKRALRMEGDNPVHHTRLGDAYLFAENASQAIAHYRRALQVNPTHAETHSSLAELYRR